MRVVKCGMQGVRGKRRRIVLVELDQRSDKIGCRGVARRIFVRLKFVFTRIKAGKWLQQESKRRHDQKEQQQSYCRRRSGSRVYSEALVKPALLHQIAEGPQEEQTCRKGPGHAFGHMMSFEMPQLMR